MTKRTRHAKAERAGVRTASPTAKAAMATRRAVSPTANLIGKAWPKIIRDPIHNMLTFEDSRLDNLLLTLINTKEVQRLRRIRQLGLCDLVFPGATHTRFAHSLGVLQTARRILNRFQRLMGNELTEDHRAIVLCAALLHDVGHGPFSHAFEKVTMEDHEARTMEIIRSDGTEVNERLRAHHPQFPERIAAFFDEDPDRRPLPADVCPAFLTKIISSQLDADRFDFLLRDSHATGTDYGRFDMDWVIEQMNVKETARGKMVVLSNKAVHAAEAYVFARHHMYQSVYFHKTVRAAEVMLRLFFKRYKELLDARPELGSDLIPGVPDRIRLVFQGRISLSDYLDLDDQSVLALLKASEHSSDPLLRQLGCGIVNRRLYKALDATDTSAPQVVAFADQSREFAKSKGLIPEYSIVDDTPTDTPYKGYNPAAERPETQILVENRLGEVVELSTLAKSLGMLRDKQLLIRYYCPEELRDGVMAAAKAHLGR